MNAASSQQYKVDTQRTVGSLLASSPISEDANMSSTALSVITLRQSAQAAEQQKPALRTRLPKEALLRATKQPRVVPDSRQRNLRRPRALNVDLLSSQGCAWSHQSRFIQCSIPQPHGKIRSIAVPLSFASSRKRLLLKLNNMYGLSCEASPMFVVAAFLNQSLHEWKVMASSSI